MRCLPSTSGTTGGARGIRRARAAGGLLVAALAWAVWPSPAAAHEVPAVVRVHAFLVLEAGRARLLVRAPLGAMRDVVLPLQGPGYLDLPRAERPLRDAAMLWLGDAIRLYENGDALPPPRIAALRVSLPSEQVFDDYARALAHVTGPPLPPSTTLLPGQAWLDVLFEYPIASPASKFAIDAALGRLGLDVVTVLRFVPPGGAVRAFELRGDAGLVHLDPGWHQAALRFVAEGFRHILEGIDHLLFLLCLVIPVRRLRSLVLVVTAFTAGHSVTLLASAFDVAPGALWFPPLVETLIAASIVYMAFENIVGARLGSRWLLAFGFGLVHGFGFSFALRESLQFAGRHLLVSLVAFNAGVELGQLAVLAGLVPLLHLLFRFVLAERLGVILLSALVAHQGWHWMIERGGRLPAFEYAWPAFDLAFAARAVRWAMLLVAAAGLVWLLSLARARWEARSLPDAERGRAG
ncbi:MAG TPA: HupE/UreJ family protein [Vicinamibacterales bacterium]|nr:HupE/UreJ family protein [Vicinamibacterales bacterium]